MTFQPDLRRVALHTWRELPEPARDANSWHELGSTLAALGDRAGACAAMRNSLSIDPRRSRTLRALGNLLFDSGQFEAALVCFERFSRLRAAS